MDLFLDKKLTFEKLGQEALLSEDPNEWPQQILDQLYKQVPYASDYAPKIVLDTIDEDRRYGMGRVELHNRLAINPRDDSTPPELLGRHMAVLPIVIRDGRLAPVDLLMSNGEVEPLTEERLRTALFRPALFDSIRKRPGDLSMVEQLYPPTRQYGGARGPLIADVGASSAGVEKASSISKEALYHITPEQWSAIYDDKSIARQIGGIQKKYKLKDFHHPDIDNLVIAEAVRRHGYAPKTAEAKPEFLMDAILPTVKKAHVQAVTDQLNDDPSLRSAVLGNPAVRPFISKLAEVESRKPEEIYLQKVAHSIKPTVIQVRKVDGGFLIKTANPETMIPTADTVPRPAAVGMLGGDLVSKVESDGTTTINTQPAQKETLTDLEIGVVDSFGLYKVKTLDDNRELVGWVFPKVMAFTGELLPLAVFANGSESAMQENIAGVPVARQTDILDSEPKGTGCFYYPSDSGAVGLVPVHIRGQQESPEGTSYMAETVMGEPCQLTMVPGLREVSVIEEGHYGLPDDCGFLTLENIVDLASHPEEFLKSAEAKALPTAVRVITDGTIYSFQGMPIDKLAGVMDTQFLGLDDAVFLAAVLGQDPSMAKTAFASLRTKGQYETWFHARPVHTLKEKYAAAKVRAAKNLSEMPDLRADLLKEATPLEDPTAVDKVLSVGFLNPENVSIFMSYVPEIECVIRKLSELLLASRLGLNTVDQGAVQKSLVHLDKVVAGLKTLSTSPQA